jgi:ribosomal protein S18 acetylase RimI-like enzyme
MTEAAIRRAGPDDAAIVAELGARTFAETFGRLYPPHDLADFIALNHSATAAAQTLGDARMAVWLAEAGGEAIGYALAGPCGLPHPEVTAGCGELKRIYLLQGRQGGGIGSRLMAQALDWLEAQGRARIWIGVWSQNYAAQRLYARAGFEKVGEYDFPVGATRDHEFILRRG